MTDNDPFLKELQQRADRAHKSADRADDAPSELWQRVRAQAKTEEEERTAISTITMPTSSAPMTRPLAPAKSRGIGHYANLAATISIVIAVAVAGWFATMQLNQSGSDDGRFAFLDSTPVAEQSANCDVDPLTVDEAMSITKNPFAHMKLDEDLMESQGMRWFVSVIDEEYSQPGYVSPRAMLSGVELEPVGHKEFQDASEVAQKYLDCIATGSVGQAWRFLDPVTVHHAIHDMLPMFTTEEEVRSILTEVLSAPNAFDVWNSGIYSPLHSSGQVLINPNPELAYVVHQPPGGSVHIVDVVVAPLMIVHSDGTVALEATLSGFPLQTNGVRINNASNLAIGRSGFDGNWYVIGVAPPEPYQLPNP